MPVAVIIPRNLLVSPPFITPLQPPTATAGMARTGFGEMAYTLVLWEQLPSMVGTMVGSGSVGLLNLSLCCFLWEELEQQHG